jgi:hypothetical protein
VKILEIKDFTYLAEFFRGVSRKVVPRAGNTDRFTPLWVFDLVSTSCPSYRGANTAIDGLTHCHLQYICSYIVSGSKDTKEESLDQQSLLSQLITIQKVNNFIKNYPSFLFLSRNFMVSCVLKGTVQRDASDRSLLKEVARRLFR